MSGGAAVTSTRVAAASAGRGAVVASAVSVLSGPLLALSVAAAATILSLVESALYVHCAVTCPHDAWLAIDPGEVKYHPGGVAVNIETDASAVVSYWIWAYSLLRWITILPNGEKRRSMSVFVSSPPLR